MREIGTVIKVNSDVADVRVMRKSACGENCASCRGGCTPTESVVKAKNEICAEEGDIVVLEISDKRALKATALTYLLPLAALIFGAAIGSKSGDAMSALCGFAAMAVCYGILHVINKRMERFFDVRAVKIIPKS
jgi:sigma-E factor negative regulatory protein RseC